MKKFLLFILSSTLLLTACGGDDGGGTAGGSEYLNVNNNSTTLDIPSSETTATLIVKASPGCEWMITWDESSGWIKNISPTSGRGSQDVTITVTTNLMTKERSSTLNVTQTNGNIPPRSVTLKQMGSPEILSLSVETVSFTSTGGEQKISVNSNMQWNVEGVPTWLNVSPTSGENNGVITVTSGQNTTNGEQIAVLTIRTKGGVSKQLNIKQVAAALPTVYAPQAADVGKNEATLSFSFDSELPVTSYGICYSDTNESPDVDHDKYETRTGSATQGSPSIGLTGLSSGTTYHVRAYAVSIVGIQYSSAITFTTTSNWPEQGDNQLPN